MIECAVGTLVHEMSHFTVVGGTKDWVYGVQNCRDLAKNQPKLAQTCAANMKYVNEDFMATGFSSTGSASWTSSTGGKADD